MKFPRSIISLALCTLLGTRLLQAQTQGEPWIYSTTACPPVETTYGLPPVETVYNCPPVETTYNFNAQNVQVHSFMLSAVNADMTLHDITFRSSGTGNEPLAVSHARLYLDRDYDRSLSPADGEPIAQLGSFTRDNGYLPEEWFSRPEIPGARRGAAAAPLQGRLYVFGGYDGTSVMDSVEQYNPFTKQWAALACMPTARMGCGAALIGTKIYVMGGKSNSADLDTVECYETQTDSWTTVSSMLSARRNFACAVVNGKIYVMGGVLGSQILKSAEEYDPSTNSWRALQDIPAPRACAAAAPLGASIYLVGGCETNIALPSLFEFNTTTQVWTQKPSMPTRRMYLAAAASNLRIYAVGGCEYGNTGLKNTVEEYDPAANRWSSRAPMLTSRAHLTLSDMEGRLVAVGGFAGAVSLAKTEEFFSSGPAMALNLDMKAKQPLSFIVAYDLAGTPGSGGSYKLEIARLHAYTKTTPARDVFLMEGTRSGPTVNIHELSVPRVASVTRLDPSPTSASSVRFQVAFSEKVSGVDASDFAIAAGGGLTSASIAEVGGSGALYTVRVNTGHGDGTIRLDVLDDNSIKNADNVALGGLDSADGSYRAGDSYAVIRLLNSTPRVQSVTRLDASPTDAAQVRFEVAFSEDVTGVEASDFSLAATGLTGASIAEVSGTGALYTVRVNTGSGEGTIRLDVVDNDSIRSAKNVPLGGEGASNGDFGNGESYNILRGSSMVPRVTAISRLDANPTSASSVRFRVAFNQSVTGVDVTDFSLSAAGILGASVSEVSGSGALYTVRVNTGSGDGSLRLNVVDDDSIRGAQDVPLGGAGASNGNFVAGDSYTLARTRPQVNATAYLNTVPFSYDIRANNALVMAFGVSSANLDAKLYSLRLKAKGSGDDVAAVAAARLYLDRDNDLKLTAADGEPIAQLGTFSVNDGVLQAGSLEAPLGISMPAQQTVRFLVAMDFSGANGLAGTYGLNIAGVTAARADNPQVCNEGLNGELSGSFFQLIDETATLSALARTEPPAGSESYYSAAVNAPVMSFSLSADTNHAMRVQRIAFSSSGGANDDRDILSAKLFIDVDGDRQIGPADILVQEIPGAYTRDDGMIYFSGELGTIPTGGSLNYVLAYDFASAMINAPSSFTTTLAAATACIDPTLNQARSTYPNGKQGPTVMVYNSPNQLETLSPGQTVNGQLGTLGARVYVLSAGDCRNLLLRLNAGFSQGQIELYARRGQVPTRFEYDYFAPDASSSATQELLLPDAQGDPWYILLWGAFLPEGAASFSLEARCIDLRVGAVTPAVAANLGPVTCRVSGSGFTPEMDVKLVSREGVVVPGTALQLIGSTALEATFDLAGATSGRYDVVVHRAQDDSEARLAGAFEVCLASVGARLEVKFVGPTTVFANRVFCVSLRYQNTGDMSMPAPLIYVTGPAGTRMSLMQEGPFSADPLWILGVSDCPGGILPPGAWREVPIYFNVTQGGTLKAFSVQDYNRPASWSGSLWATWGDYRRDLMAAAHRLQQRGIIECGAGTLEELVRKEKAGEPASAICGTVRLRGGLGGFLNGVGVKATNNATGAVFEARTDGRGKFILASLPAGEYTLSVPGYTLSQLVQVEVTDQSDVLGVELSVLEGSRISGLWAYPKFAHNGQGHSFLQASLVATHAIVIGTPCDPNEKIGPVGQGDAATQRFVSPGEELFYTVKFENVSTATLPAQEVIISDQLSKSLDWNSFVLENVAFGSHTVESLAGLKSGATLVDMDGGTLLVRVEGSIDPLTGIAHWALRCINPDTGSLPFDPSVGLLPPNDESGRGEGQVTFRVKVRPDVAPGTRITNHASIVFDNENPIVTNEVFNTVSAEAPGALNVLEPANAATAFPVNGVLSCTEAPYATSYSFYLWKQGETKPAQPTAANLATPYFDPSGELEPFTTYYWQVVAKNASGEKASEVWSFVTGGPSVQADLTLAMTAAPEPLELGGNITYTVQVSNTGPSAASEVVVTDHLPAGVNVVSATSSKGTPQVSGQLVTLALGELARNASATVTVIVSPTAVGQVTNQAETSAKEYDPNTQNNSASVVTNIENHHTVTADVALSQSVQPDPLTLGATATYTYSVRNNGADPATGVLFTSKLPQNALLASVSADRGPANLVGDQVVAEIGSLAKDEVVNVVVALTPTAPGVFKTQASVSAEQQDANPQNNVCSGELQVNVGPGSDLAAVWSSLGQSLKNSRAGGTTCQLRGKLQITNTGDQDAGKSTLLVYLSDSPVVGTTSTLLKQQNIGKIRKGKSTRVSLSVKLPSGVTATGKYVIAVVDGLKVVAEANEFNNSVVYGPVQ